MTKVNVRLTSVHSKKGDNFESYIADFRIGDYHFPSPASYGDLKKIAFDILYEVIYRKVEDPKYEVRLFTGEDYFVNFKTRYCKKPSEDEKRELIKNIKSRQINNKARSLASFCLKNKKSFEEE